VRASHMALATYHSDQAISLLCRHDTYWADGWKKQPQYSRRHSGVHSFFALVVGGEGCGRQATAAASFLMVQLLFLGCLNDNSLCLPHHAHWNAATRYTHRR
jgi:hypothetical protein